MPIKRIHKICPTARGPLDSKHIPVIVLLMATPTEENFKYYKKAESKALEIVAEMKSTTPKKMDIELSLLVAIFELHKGELPAEAIGKIVEGHLQQIVPYYASMSADAP